MAIESGPFLCGCDKSNNANSCGKKTRTKSMKQQNQKRKKTPEKSEKIRKKKKTKTVEVRHTVYIGGKLSLIR